MVYKNISFKKRGNIGILKINRPKVLNSLNKEVLRELEKILDEILLNKDILVLIITGEGRSFVAGADISAMSKMSQFEAREFVLFGQRVLNKIENLPIPVIAAINGYALGGGCELAMACDIRWASEKANFGQPEVSLGITPGFCGTQRLPRICGPAIAKELIYSGVIIDAQRALEIGLVTKVVSPELLISEVLEFAEKIASQSPIAVSLSKSAIVRGYDSNFLTGSKYEAEVFTISMSCWQSSEGMSAFLEKRKPNWNREKT